MDTEDKRDEVQDERKEELREEEKREAANEAIQEAEQEEIRNFADDRIDPAPNGFWGQRGTWWILGIAGILIVFLVIWVCFFYGPN